MRQDLRTILARDNRWLESPDNLGAWLDSHLPARYVARETVRANAARWRQVSRAHLVVGPRQAGKSTGVWAHLAALREPVLFIDCEQPLVHEWCRSAPLFLADLEAALARPVTLFFEEAQHLESAGLFFKGLVDRKVGVPILITGSSSLHLGAQVRESLAGRATRSRLLPFSLEEVCADLAEMPPLVRAQQTEERLARHVAVGGYPDVWLSQTPGAVLADLGEALVLRDASDLFRIRRPDAFRRLLRLAAAQVGGLVNLSDWAAVLGVSRDTVAAYLEILETSHIVAVLRPFAGGKRSELTRAQKVYFIDNGIRHHLVGDVRLPDDRVDVGAALENWVFSELWKALPANAEIRFWRSTSKAEVDFVVSAGLLVIGLEVKAARLARPTLSRSARSFIDAYAPKAFFVVSRGVTHEEEAADTTVRWVSPQELVPSLVRLLG
jgi:predicted AAA+ superfamily ATPase